MAPISTRGCACSIRHFTNAVQRLLNAVIATLEGKQADDSAIGITGLNFGTSRATSFVTFSRVVAEISSGQVLPLLNRTVKGKGGCRCADQEPDACDISVGSVSAGVALDGVRVGSGSLTPLRLGAGLGRLDVTADVTLSDGSNGAGDEVAQLVKAFLATQLPGSPAATIDHLSNVTISVPVSLLSSVLPTSFTEGKGGIFAFDSTSWLDLSPVLPNSEIVMAVSADYFNPLGVGASLPYGGASVGLMEDPAAGDPGSGSMSPTIRVKIPKNTGKIPVDFKIPTGSLVYGGSATDMSALLSKVTLDWHVLERCELGDIISSIINRVLPFPLQRLSTISLHCPIALNTASGTIRIVVPEIRIRLPFGVNGNVGGVRMSVEGEMTRIVVPGVVAGFTDEEIFKAFLEERIGIDFIQCLVRWAKVNLERVILGASHLT
ncbi:hypothetical protein BC829DRAFT_390040, partial [Chytridium lagenaria]